MAPPRFSFRRRRRRGVSELYASMLMVGVTLSLGGVVVAAALGSFGQAENSASIGASLQGTEAGTQVSLVYASVTPSGSCPVYRGAQEGTSLTIFLFDYGEIAFSPSEFAVNSTFYQGNFSAIGPGALGEYTLALGSCAHPSGLTMAAADSSGDEVQFGS